MSNKVFVARVDDAAKLPTKRNEDGGYDIYGIIKDNECYKFQPFEIKLIPTGIKMAFPPKYRYVLRERGSSGIKGLAVRAGVIDSGFRGELFVAIQNLNLTQLIIAPQTYLNTINSLVASGTVLYPIEKAICQALFEEVPSLNIIETSEKTLMEFTSERGEGMLGASGK